MAIAALVICLAGLPAAGARAHELGTTRVSIAVGDEGRYAIEIVTDAAALATRLGAAADGPAGGSASPALLRDALAARADVFAGRVRWSCAGTEAQTPVFAVAPPAEPFAPARATIRLHGVVPPDVAACTWSYGWTSTAYTLTVRTPGASAQATTVWIDGGETSPAIDFRATSGAGHRLAGIAAQYVALGFTHILPKGLDHVLFVLGIFLLGRGLRDVLLQVTAFTVAHSLTLAASTLGTIAVPAAVVEPLIAVSIAYVAFENIWFAHRPARRTAVVFAFGLLHGLGFAGVLTELGLPASAFATALVSFNLGVEAGQLAVLGLAFALIGWRFSGRPWYRVRVVIPASVALATAGIYWTVERLAAL